MRISQYRLANGITVETVLRLGYFFATEPQLRMNLAARYALEVTKDMLAGRLERGIGAPGHAAWLSPA